MPKEIGQVYGDIGSLEYDDQTGLLTLKITDPTAVNINIQEIIQGINLDLFNREPLTTAREDAYALKIPPSDGGLDMLEDAISLQSGGQVILRHFSPMLDHQTGSDL